MSETHITALQKLVDDKGILLSDTDMAGYEAGWRGDVGKAMCVLRPNSTKSLSNIIAYCTRENIHVIPQSGNTGMVAGSTPDDSGTQVVINLERMNAIIEIDPVNKSAHVGAGVRLSALNAALEEHGLYLPIDLGADPCIGGMVSTNTGGSRFLKYRGFRDHVMGIKAVMADKDGTVIDALNALHKNNTGLDITQLFVGTAGLFGVVSEVILRLSPFPQQSAAAILVPASLHSVPDLLIAVETRCSNYLSAFEGISHHALIRAFEHNPSLPSPFGQEDIPDYTILLELTRSWPSRAAEQSLDDVLESLLGELWERETPLLENAYIGAPEKLWAMRHGISEGVQKSGTLFAFDISFKRGDLMRFREDMTKRLSKDYPELTVCDFGHLGDGGVHFALVIDPNDPRSKDASYEQVLRKYMNDAVVNEYGGSYSAEHCLGRKTQSAYDAYTPEDIKMITRKIKAAIAPAAIGTTEI